MRGSLSTLVLVVSVGASGCASAGGGRSDADCTSGLPPDSESLTEVLDSAAFSRVLPGYWDPAWGLTLATLRWDSAGALKSTTVASALASEASKSRLEKTLALYAAPDRAPTETAYVVLGDTAGSSPRRVHQFRLRSPALLNRDLVVKFMQQEADNLAATLVGRAIVRVSVKVETDGHVSEARVERNSSNLEVDAAAIRVMMRATFRPARLEGIPQVVWANFPVTFQTA